MRPQAVHLHVKGHSGTYLADMGKGIDSRRADMYPHIGWIAWAEGLDLPPHRVEQPQPVHV